MHELARVPVATGKVESVGQLSGIALEILSAAKNRAKRVTYGEMIVELNRRLLVLGGYGSDKTTSPLQELLPSNSGRGWRGTHAQALGVSADTLIRSSVTTPTQRGKEGKRDRYRAVLTKRV